MGNTLAPMQRDLALIDSESARDAKEMLDRLEDMAQDRLDLFYEKIGHDDFDKHLIPINKVLNKYTYVGVTAEENDGWIQEVKEAVKEYSTGPVADGLSSVTTNTIVKMLGSSAGKRQTTQRYAISIDWLGGISRLDYYIFTYTFSSTELVKRDASLLACCVVESSAKIEDIDLNTLRVIVSRAFKGGDIPHSTLTAIYAQLVTAVNEPVNDLSLTEEEKASLEDWYNPGSQKSLKNGGFNAFFNAGSNGNSNGNSNGGSKGGSKGGSNGNSNGNSNR